MAVASLCFLVCFVSSLCIIFLGFLRKNRDLVILLLCYMEKAIEFWLCCVCFLLCFPGFFALSLLKMSRCAIKNPKKTIWFLWASHF